MRRAAPLLLAAVLAGGCGGVKESAPPKPSGNRFAGTALAATPAPDVALRDQDGRLVRLSQLRGQTVLVTFLYTHCPDVCPLIATNLGLALRRLGPAAGDVRVLAISVDPKGDTLAAVRRFVRRHRLPPQFRYLHGTRAQLAPVWHAYHVAVLDGPEATVDHSSYTMLIDRRGNERVLYDARTRPAEVVHDLRALG